MTIHNMRSCPGMCLHLFALLRKTLSFLCARTRSGMQDVDFADPDCCSQQCSWPRFSSDIYTVLQMYVFACGLHVLL